MTISIQRLIDDIKCYEMVRELRWRDGVTCPHRGISQEKLPVYIAFFQFVHNARKRGAALFESLIRTLL